MKPSILFFFFISIACAAFSQESDFIVLKKKNNRTVKTYAEGSFLSGRLYNGFDVHGYIRLIRNDSIYLVQQDIKLMGTEFGSTLDTVTYRVAFDYRQLMKFNYENADAFGRHKGFAVLTIPGLMIVGGSGFVILELINGLYRKESFNANNRLVSLGIGAGVALAGALWMHAKNKKENGKTKLNVVYVKAGSIQFKP